MFLVGIDLGTSNCAVAFAEADRGPDAPVTDLPIPQLQRPGQLAEQLLLPSCIYFPTEFELPSESVGLPWKSTDKCVVGEFARWQGARVPGRMVSSAKSWLCHTGVDRSAAILPWGAPPDAPRISPVRASALFLRHIAAAWRHARPDAPLNEQEIVITVPASFDEAARALTVSAAQEAALEKFTLLEEPQAAFYDFTARHRRDLQSVLQDVRLILVVDVGGGTTDLTLVQVGVSPEGPVLRRIAVGDHLILGGDNMDAALARRAEERFVSGGRKLSASQWQQLVQAARLAKEALLGPNPPDLFSLAVATEGSQLVGGGLSTSLSRAEVENVIVNGFLPFCNADEVPERSTRVALQEIGLPYVQDPAITRHIAAFLRRHAAAGFAALAQQSPDAHALPRPDALLLNGGVFNSSTLVDRLSAVLARWWPQSPPLAVLQHSSLDLAVARGAAYYGLVRKGLGKRITGGAAHALYVGLEKSGANEPLALCVVPRGQEETETIDVGSRVFQLTLGRPVRFPLFSSSSDRLERAGDVVPVSEDMQRLPAIHTVLKGTSPKATRVPVHLRASLTEIGTMELWCISNTSGDRWRLEFELRETAATGDGTVTESVPAHFAEARTLAEQVYGHRSAFGRGGADAKTAAGKEVKGLWSGLERVLGPREEWRVAVLRELWGVLFAGAARRRRSSDHERIFFQLLGYSLRPGYGYALDEWRCEQAARLFGEGVQAVREKPVWTEFWVLWRRIAGGLSPARHEEIWALLKPHLAHRVPPQVPKHVAKPKGVNLEGFDEMVRLAAALEHLSPAEKVLLGDWIALRLQSGSGAAGPWAAALGRLGARVPMYGSMHNVIDPEKGAEWVHVLLRPEVVRVEGALFAISQLARLTGDRARDLDDAVRGEVLRVLEASGSPDSWVTMVRERAAMAASDQARVLGDTLPVGLQLP
jgi:molecular chaperone DnaK (HSP70)